MGRKFCWVSLGKSIVFKSAEGCSLVGGALIFVMKVLSVVEKIDVCPQKPLVLRKTQICSEYISTG